MRPFVELIVCLAIVFAAAAVGGAATSASVSPDDGGPSWYAEIAKPSWTPPAWLFGPVWTALYILMAVSAWLVWRQRPVAPPGAVNIAITLFLAQLVLNALWSVVFSGLRRPGWAFAEILALEAALLATIGVFFRIRPAAAVLLVPYAAWVGFAACLNGAIWRLSR